MRPTFLMQHHFSQGGKRREFKPVRLEHVDEGLKLSEHAGTPKRKSQSACSGNPLRHDRVGLGRGLERMNVQDIHRLFLQISFEEHLHSCLREDTQVPSTGNRNLFSGKRQGADLKFKKVFETVNSRQLLLKSPHVKLAIQWMVAE